MENAVSGERMHSGVSAFLGVVRPDVLARMDLDALTGEYRESCAQAAFGNSAETEADADDLEL